MPQLLSVSWPLEVQMMTGMPLVASSLARVRVAWKPLWPGITTSISTRSGRACFTLTSASSALSAVKTLKPFLVRMSLRYWRSVGESSTTSTFLIGMKWPFSVSSRYRVGLDVERDRLQQALFGKRFGQVLVGARQPAAGAIENAVLAGEHDHRRRPEIGVLLDERAGLIAVEPRHHDVDEDHLWPVVADLG